MSEKWHGGKGDSRRKTANDKKYKAGWDKIWSDKKNDKKE